MEDNTYKEWEVYIFHGGQLNLPSYREARCSLEKPQELRNEINFTVRQFIEPYSLSVSARDLIAFQLLIAKPNS